MNTKTPLFTIAVLAIVSSFFSCTSSTPDKAVKIFKVKQLNRQLTNVDIDNNGVDKGDQMIFSGDVVDENGSKGLLFGYNQIIEMPDSSDQSNQQIRLSNIVFRFGNDQLIVSGAVDYPKAGDEIKTSDPQAKAIIGGTGKFIGASGEVITKRLESGIYEHEFRLLR